MEEFTQEDLEDLAALGISQDKIEALRNQMNNTQRRMDQPGPQGRQAGRVFVASNPLEHIAKGVQDYRGHRQNQQRQGQIDALQGQVAQSRAGLMARILGGGQQPQPNPMMQYDPTRMRGA